MKFIVRLFDVLFCTSSSRVCMLELLVIEPRFQDEGVMERDVRYVDIRISRTRTAAYFFI